MAHDLTPHRDFSTASCREQVKALDNAVEVLTQWGVKISEQAALFKARGWLADLGSRETLDLTPEALEETSKHSALAVDLYHITVALGDESNDLIAKELSQIVRGSPFDTASVQDFISQYWVGTLLAQSKLKPGIDARIEAEGPRPDFLAECRTLGFVVEVKCPKSPSSAIRALSTAAKQLRDKPQPGVIFVDATYALGLNPYANTEPESSARDMYREANSRLHDRLESYAANYTRSDKFSRVAVIATFSRFWTWILADPPERDAGLVLNASVLPEACQGLVVEQATGFQTSLFRGIEQLTGNPASVTTR